jgi:hypothetical protein
MHRRWPVQDMEPAAVIEMIRRRSACAGRSFFAAHRSAAQRKVRFTKPGAGLPS